MSFRRDLERWAAMEWARRHPTNRRSIEALLYPPHRSERQHAVRTGIAPSIGIGTPVSRYGGVVDVDDAFMESGWTKVITGTEEDFESVIYLTDTQSTMQGGYPTWLDWIGEVDGSIENTRRTYVAGMTSLAMVYDKVIVSPTPQFLVCAVSGKLQMMAQAQYGTQLGVGTISLQDYLDGGGSVTTGP